MGRKPKYEWELLLNTAEDAPCGLDKQCQASHALVWVLHRGSDFPADMTVFSLQTAMHAKAKYLGIKCHTRRIGNLALQVQFFRLETR
jgi:hypothetical protein